MADRYKVIVRRDVCDEESAPSWEYGCPAQITVYQVSRDTDTAELFLQLRVRNVSGSTIRSIRLEADISRDDGSTERTEIERLDVDLEPGGTVDLKPATLGRGSIAKVDVLVSSIDIDGGWITNDGPQPLPGKMTLDIDSRQLAARRRALADGGARDVEKVLHGMVQNYQDFWVCACGQVNVGRETCCSCGWGKDELVRLEDTKTLDSIATEDERQQAEKKERQKVVARRAKRLAVVAAALAVVGVAVWALYTNVIQPNMTYSEALSLIDQGDYDGGISLLEGLGDYGDATDQLEAARDARNDQRLQDARDLIAAGNYEDGINELQLLGATSEAWAAKYEYASTHPDHDDQLTFEYLQDLVSMNPISAKQLSISDVYENAQRLYDELYSWKIRLVVNSSKSDWDTAMTEYESRDSSSGLVGNYYAYAHVEVINAPLTTPNGLIFAKVKTQDENGSFSLADQEADVIFTANDSGSINGACETSYIKLLGTVKTGTRCNVVVSVDGSDVASQTLTNVNGL